MVTEETPAENSPKPEDSKKIAVRVILEGRVQKVGMRQWIKQKAAHLKIYGWVRNRETGTVEALFYGPEAVVSTMIRLCYRGPSFAYIKRIKEFPQTDIISVPMEFIILPTI